MSSHDRLGALYGSTWPESTLSGSNWVERDPYWGPRPLLRPPAPNLSEAATPPLASVEGRDSCSALALERGERRAELLSVQKDFSYVSIRPQRAPNIAQLTSHRRPRLARPHRLHLQAAACGAVIKVRVLFPATLSSFLKCTRPIWAIICRESEIAITNNKGFRPPVCCPGGLIRS